MTRELHDAISRDAVKLGIPWSHIAEKALMEDFLPSSNSHRKAENASSMQVAEPSAEATEEPAWVASPLPKE